MSVGGCGKLRIQKNVGIVSIRIRVLSSSSERIDAHVVRMRSDCRNLHRSRCTVLEQHGEQHDRSVVRRELKREQINL